LWSIQHTISHQGINELLKILRNHNCFTSILPADARTLLKTPRCINSKLLSPGSYVHLGLRKGIITTLGRTTDLASITKVQVLISVDGIPVSKSSKSEFWPI